MYHQPNPSMEIIKTTKIVNVTKQNNNDERPIINLPDILRENLDMIVVGITPSGMLGVSNHHFSGPGNHFWRCIAEVGLVSHPVTCEDDSKMLDYGIGFISFCTRPNKGTTELSRKEMKIGAALMVEKIKKYKPKIVVFNGIGIYEAFIGNKNFSMGLQPNKMEGTDSVIFVMPSSSARCAQLPRAEDKIPFFVSLKKLRDHIRGDLAQLEEKEVVFENYTEFRVTQPDPRSLLKAERRRKRKAELNAESALTHPENSTENNDESIKSKLQPQQLQSISQLPQPDIEISKDEKFHEPGIVTTSQSAIQAIVNSPLISAWPQNGGLAIIHTGQSIIVPSSSTGGNQTASSNTLLLLDPSGLSFSPIPVPINPTAHLQVRPLIVSPANDCTENVSRLGTSSSQPLIGSIKQSDPHMSFNSMQQMAKARPIANEIQKVTQVKAQTKAIPSSDNLKSVKVNTIVPPPVETSKAILTDIHSSSSSSTPLSAINKSISSAETEQQTDCQIVPIQTNLTPDSINEIESQPCRFNDPIDHWELFMNGIYTGEFCYPAPPQSVAVKTTETLLEQDRLSQTNTSRILTVL